MADKETNMGKMAGRQTSRVSCALDQTERLVDIHHAGLRFIELLKQKILPNISCLAEMSRIPVTNCTYCDMVFWLVTLFSGKHSFVVLSYFFFSVKAGL